MAAREQDPCPRRFWWGQDLSHGPGPQFTMGHFPRHAEALGWGGGVPSWAGFRSSDTPCTPHDCSACDTAMHPVPPELANPKTEADRESNRSPGPHIRHKYVSRRAQVLRHAFGGSAAIRDAMLWKAS